MLLIHRGVLSVDFSNSAPVRLHRKKHKLCDILTAVVRKSFSFISILIKFTDNPEFIRRMAGIVR